jgi:hypothetical protein
MVIIWLMRAPMFSASLRYSPPVHAGLFIQVGSGSWGQTVVMLGDNEAKHTMQNMSWIKDFFFPENFW